MDLISVIVPIYKVEAYLDRCVQSIVDQTYPNLEIILVDDGSPDRCPAMCDVWAEKDKRIKVIHKENGGLSDARNAGMAVSRGELIGFIDSDDYIAPEMYQILYDLLQKDGSDIAACGVEMVYEDGTSPCPLTPAGNTLLDNSAAMEAVIRETWLKQPVWYKLYKAELIRDIPFPVGKYHEDVFWTWQAVARAGKVSVTDTPYYYYVQRNGSIMAERYSVRRLDAIEGKQQRLVYLETAYPDLAGLARADLMFSGMYHGQLALKHLVGSERSQVLAQLKDTVCRVHSSSGHLSASHKFWIFLAKRSIVLCCKFRNLLRIGL